MEGGERESISGGRGEGECKWREGRGWLDPGVRITVDWTTEMMDYWQRVYTLIYLFPQGTVFTEGQGICSRSPRASQLIHGLSSIFLHLQKKQCH